MKKLKIYLDTSVISHLIANDTPEKMQDTLRLWDLIKDNTFEVIISDITFEELAKCNEPKRSLLAELIDQIEFSDDNETEESLLLVNKYLQYNVLNEKSRDDLRHIALATVLKCDLIISWNFKHFVNVNVINKVQATNRFEGYSEIMILPPSMLIGGNENDD